MPPRPNFSSRLRDAIKTQSSFLCCGLDPDPDRLPPELDRKGSIDDRVVAFLRGVIDATCAHACAYKIQRAYFDLLDHPKRVLLETIDYARSKSKLPIILDAKIGETENSMKAYLKYLAEDLKVDAAVVNPYMGDEVLAPFGPEAICGAVVLVRTSNPGSLVIQDQLLATGEKLWENVLRIVIEREAAGFDVIPVLASTAEIAESSILRELPIDVPIFIAGYGAQGGSLELVRSLVRSGHNYIVVNSSRDILFAHERTPSVPWQMAVSDAAIRTRRSISEH